MMRLEKLLSAKAAPLRTCRERVLDFLEENGCEAWTAKDLMSVLDVHRDTMISTLVKIRSEHSELVGWKRIKTTDGVVTYYFWRKQK